MTVQEVAKMVMKVTGHTQQQVAEATGMSGQGALSVVLRGKSMRVDTVLRILSACGYELVARSKDGRNPEYVIGNEAGDAVPEEKMSILEKNAEGPALEDLIRKVVAEELAKATPGRDE